MTDPESPNLYMPPNVRDVLFMLTEPDALSDDNARVYRAKLLEHRGLEDNVEHLRSLGCAYLLTVPLVVKNHLTVKIQQMFADAVPRFRTQEIR